MGNNMKSAPFGAMQKVVLTPKEGYEVEAVEVINNTNKKVVPSQLTKINNEPPQWTCTFQVPAGAVAIRPKLRPIFYSVIIEECENCNIVLLECADAVDIQVAGEEAKGPSDVPENFNQPQHLTENDGATLSVGEDSAHEEHIDPTAEEFSYIDDSIVNEDDEEDEDVEPVVITKSLKDKRDEAFWKHRKAFEAGQISKKKFDEVQKKHMKFLDDITDGKIIVK